MKINPLDAHDRLLSFKKDQAVNIFNGAEDCLKRNPLSLALQDRSSYIYIFAHPRTADDGVTQKMLWQPRLTRPEAQTNSYLFRAQSKTDIIEVCWLLPPEELWEQYDMGLVTENKLVSESIYNFRFHKAKMEAKQNDDMEDEKIFAIYREIRQGIKIKKVILE